MDFDLDAGGDEAERWAAGGPGDPQPVEAELARDLARSGSNPGTWVFQKEIRQRGYDGCTFKRPPSHRIINPAYSANPVNSPMRMANAVYTSLPRALS